MFPSSNERIPLGGIGIDPNWVEISWEEALPIAVKKLKEVHDHDPRIPFPGRDDNLCVRDARPSFVDLRQRPSAWMLCGVAGGGIDPRQSGADEIGGLTHVPGCSFRIQDLQLRHLFWRE